MLTAPAVPKWRQPLLLHLPTKSFADWQCVPLGLPSSIDVDAKSGSAPSPHLLSEVDFFPTDRVVALRIKNKS